MNKQCRAGCPQLSPREREIAIAAIGARVSGEPSAAAKQLLAGVAVLDGQHTPILIWPEGIAREEMAAWHEAEAAYWRESAARYAEITERAQRSDTGTLRDSRGDLSTDELDTPPAPLASSPEAHRASEKENHPQSSAGEPVQGASDAC